MTDIQVSKKRLRSPSLSALENKEGTESPVTKHARTLSLLPKDDSLPQDMWFSILDVLREEALGMSCWATIMLAQTSHVHHDLVQAYITRYPFKALTLRILGMVGITRWPSETLTEWLAGPAHFMVKKMDNVWIGEWLCRRFILHRKQEPLDCLTPILDAITWIYGRPHFFIDMLIRPLFFYVIDHDLMEAAQLLVQRLIKNNSGFLMSHIFVAMQRENDIDNYINYHDDVRTLAQFSDECVRELAYGGANAQLEECLELAVDSTDFYSELIQHALQYHAFEMLEFLCNLSTPATIGWNIALLHVLWWVRSDTVIYDESQVTALLRHLPTRSSLLDNGDPHESPTVARVDLLWKLTETARVSANLKALRCLLYVRQQFIEELDKPVHIMALLDSSTLEMETVVFEHMAAAARLGDAGDDDDDDDHDNHEDAEEEADVVVPVENYGYIDE